MRRGMRCITLGAAADTLLRRLVVAAQQDARVAARLGLTNQPTQQRLLTRTEIECLGALISRPELTTTDAVMRALPTVDPELANRATRLLDTYYRTAPRVNASRVIEALIYQGAQVAHTEEISAVVPHAASGDAAEAVN